VALNGSDTTEEIRHWQFEDAYCYGTMARRAPVTSNGAIKCASRESRWTLIEKGTEKSYILLPQDASALSPGRDLANGRRR